MYLVSSHGIEHRLLFYAANCVLHVLGHFGFFGQFARSHRMLRHLPLLVTMTSSVIWCFMLLIVSVQADTCLGGDGCICVGGKVGVRAFFWRAWSQIVHLDFRGGGSGEDF